MEAGHLRAVAIQVDPRLYLHLCRLQEEMHREEEEVIYRSIRNKTKPKSIENETWFDDDGEI